jgi:O-antigen/teichoic acid export membrane protein
MFTVTILVAGGSALMLGIPGYFIGALGLSLGNLTSAVIIWIGLNRFREKPIRPVPTTTSMGQIR